MAHTDRYDSALSIFMNRHIRNNIHTNIRGEVVGVDYTGPTVDIQPSASTEFSNGVVDSYPVIYDVPVHLPSGTGGKARLTMPIKVGDFVGLSFSERNENDSSDQNTHQLFAGWAVTQVFSDGNAKPIHPDNVVLENDKGSLTQKPDGEINIKNPEVDVTYMPDGNIKVANSKVSFIITPEGDVTLTNGSGSVKLEQSGQLSCNGATITREGRIITSSGVDLDSLNAKFLIHRHTDVMGGVGISGGPIFAGG